MLEEVQKEMSRFGKSVIKQSRSNLTRKGHNDTKDLYNSLDYELNVHKNSFSLSFYMIEYGAYQDEGVRGAYSNKRAPNSPFRYKRNKPIGGKPFEKWAKRKGISPWAVDILYQSIEPIEELRAFECYPKPCGIHSFSGLSHYYDIEYYNKFPELKPIEEIINE